MNEDIYAEWLVKCKSPWYQIPAIILAGVLLAGSFMIFLMGKWWGSIPFIAVILLLMFCWRYLKYEYEYVFVTSELSIDVIYSQNTRKNKRKIEMADVESVEPTNAERNKELASRKNIKIEDFSSKTGAETYTILYAQKGEQKLLVFEPNDKLLKAMWRCSPRKVTMNK